MTPLQYEELHFPGSLVRLLSLTRSAAPGPCGKSYDELELRRGTSIILALDALLSVFPSFPFCPSHHRTAVSAHWYFMGPWQSLQNKELKQLFFPIENLGICQKVLEAQNPLIYDLFCHLGVILI